MELDLLQKVFLEVEEEDCPAARMGKLQEQVQLMQGRKERMLPLLKLVTERATVLEKAKSFEDNKNNAQRFAKNANSAKFLEEEKFRKNFVKRLSKLLPLHERT